MNAIPISLLFFTSTKGHFGHKDVYLTTLNHLERQIPLATFAAKVAHIKVGTDDGEAGARMATELERRGFKVIQTVADWKRGTSHQQAYMADVVRVSKEVSIYANPHIWWLEDDEAIRCHEGSLEEVLARMVRLVESSPDVLSARFLRAGDLASSPILKQEKDHFWSPHLNFQEPLMRSRDFDLVCKIIEHNWAQIQQIQCEMLWRLMLAPFSRSELKHIVWNPGYAETIHLGTPDYPRLKQELGL